MDKPLTQNEKTRLTNFARDLVTRGARMAAVKTNEPGRISSTALPVDAFSPEAMRQRLIALEKKYEDLGRHVESSVLAILTTLQQLETRVARACGELGAFREEFDARQGSKSYERDELMASAKEYAAVLNAEIASLVKRLDADDKVKDKSERNVDG